MVADPQRSARLRTGNGSSERPCVGTLIPTEGFADTEEVKPVAGVLSRGPIVVLGLACLGLFGVGLSFNVHSLANALLCGAALFLAFQAFVMWISIRLTNIEQPPTPQVVWNFFSLFFLVIFGLLLAAVVALIAGGTFTSGNLLATFATTLGSMAVLAWVWWAAQFCAKARGTK